MGVFCVCFAGSDTGESRPDNPREKIGHLGEVCELTPSTWLLDTTLHTRGILNRLEGVLGNHDQLVVFEVTKQGEWSLMQGPKVTHENTAVWLERHVGQS